MNIICKKNNLLLIEDTAWGCGGSYKEKKLGTWGDIGTFSLQLNKDITSGEGGMVVTRDKELNDRVDALHNAGYIKKEKNNINWYGDIPYGWGHGRRMSELQGAVARVQLKN